MPTPVAAARQCLTNDAAVALEEAVAVARRRGHSQTTSLHMVSSLLSLPNSSLREACKRTRNNAYSTRVQLNVLELTLSVSLDRLPCSQATRVEEPPVSNSLMAAIKRSQANQRRQPESFGFYQQQQQYSSGSSVPIVKIELQSLMLSILDDPLVSRVFGEAGFRSCDIKMAIFRPSNSLHARHLSAYYSGYKRPNSPLFLCNLSGSDKNTELGRGYSFPFMRKIEGILPVGLSGLAVVCVEDEVLRSVNEESLKLRLLEEHGGKLWLIGTAATYDVFLKILNKFPSIQKEWDLEILPITSLKLSMGGSYPRSRVQLRDLLLINLRQRNRSRIAFPVNLWPFLMRNAEVCFEWLTFMQFPLYYARTLQLKSFIYMIQSFMVVVLSFSSRSIIDEFSLVLDSLNCLESLMESFVPLGGFFSMPSDTKSSLSSACQYIALCHQCNEKYKQEVKELSNGGRCSPVTNQNELSLHSWPQPNRSNGFATKKVCYYVTTKLNSLCSAQLVGSVKCSGIQCLQKKWDSICQQHHYNQPSLKGRSPHLDYQFPRVLGFQVAEEKREDTSNHSSSHSNTSSTEQGNKNVISSLSTDLRQSSLFKEFRSLDMLSKTKNPSVLPESIEIPPKKFIDEPGGIKSHHFASSSISIGDRASPSSVTSVTTDLGLGIISFSTSQEAEKSVDESHEDLVQDLSGSLSTNAEATKSSISNRPSQFASCSSHDSYAHSNMKDPKMIYKALVERVGLCGISRGDKWINFRGPDSSSKKKLGLALEILYGSTESFIYVDLSCQDEMTSEDTVLNSQVTNKYDFTMRRTVVDYLVEELSKKPCVVFLENIDKSDPVLQNSLSQAVKTGRFTDLHGREVNVSSSMFLATTRVLEVGKSHSSGKNSAQYSEEDVLVAKGHLIQISIGFDLNDNPRYENLLQSDPTKKGCSNPNLMNKRKLIRRSRNTDQCGNLEVAKRAHKASNFHLDLNLPVQANETWESHSDSNSETASSWLEDFDRQIDRVIIFKPFDFDKLAEKLSADMSECLHGIVGTKCLLEIERNVMLQLIAAAYLLGNKTVEGWIQHVLKHSFAEAMGKFSLNACSIVKVVAFGGDLGDEHTEGLLPASIIVN
ncbi:protein SMAX1-LIKE 7 [Sesamum angolense]|uniref:Protein SMAX1-LIKE 7 n=1 Tax=Sesamum angolense TaxID=2727404 RepID=A0AAE1X191_9LAMI|nr:protein SMAX1-LIKE 7 [Sesamum angolense]